MKKTITSLFIIILVTSFMSFIYFKANAGGGFGVSGSTQGGNTSAQGSGSTGDPPGPGAPPPTPKCKTDADCVLSHICSNGVCKNGLCEGWESYCDPGTTCDGAGMCLPTDMATCGNGVKESGEDCEPPNSLGDDLYSNGCGPGYFCNYECKCQSNTCPADCNGACVKNGQFGMCAGDAQNCDCITLPPPPPPEPRCGDGNRDPGEECEPVGSLGDDYFTNGCAVGYFCNFQCNCQPNSCPADCNDICHTGERIGMCANDQNGTCKCW